MLPRRGLLLGMLVGFVAPVLPAGRYDAQIQQEFEKAVSSNPRFQNVRATTEDGIVTLTGTVTLYNDKLEADRKTHRLKYVGGVRNNIEVEGSQ